MNTDIDTKESISNKVIRNTGYNAAGRLFGIVVALFLTPYIIRHLGVERFGVWAIIGVMTGYFGMLDFGIGSSFVKYIAEFYTKKDYKKINELVNTGFFFYLVLAVTIIVLAFLCIHPLLRFFKIPQKHYSEAVFVFSVTIVIFCFSSVLSIFFAIQNGLQRMDIVNKLSITVSVFNIIGTIFFLQNGYGLRGLIVNNVIIFVVTSVLSIVIAFKLLPELKVSFSLISKEMFGKLFSFGIKLQIARFATMAAKDIDKLLIAYFLSIGMVTFFQLGSSVVEQVTSIGILFMSALVPAFSQIEARSGREELADGYIRGTKYLALVTIPLNIFIIISAYQIMFIWMGFGYENSARVIQILSVTWGVAILCGIRGVIIQAIARTDIEMKAGLVAFLLNIPLSIILIVKFGFIGVAFGTLIAFMASATYGAVLFHKELKLPLRQLIKTRILDIIVVCIFSGILVRVLAIGSYTFFRHDRITTLIIFIIEGVLFFSAYLVLLSYIKPFDSLDQAILLKSRAGFVKKILCRFSK